MSALLYYSISSNLTADETIEIDQQVLKNKEKVFTFVKKIVVNGKTKKLVVVVTSASVVWLSNLESAEAIGLPLMPQNTVVLAKPDISKGIRKSKIGINYFNKPKVMFNKTFKFKHFTKSKEEMLLLVCSGVGDPKLSQVQQELLMKIFHDLKKVQRIQARGGSNVGFALTFALTFMIVTVGYAFTAGLIDGIGVTRNPGPEPNPYQPPTCARKYPPILEVLDPKRTSPSDRRGSVLREGRMNEMCPIQEDENGFVMSYDEAYKLVAETYPGYLEVNENCKITDWQAAKHIYHGKGMGINPADYGFTQEELNRIRGEKRYKGGGLIAYARRGYRLPPIEMVRAYSEKLKESCEQAPIKRTNVPYYDVNGKWNSTVYAIPPSERNSSGIIIAFNESSMDLITGDHQRLTAFNRFRDKNYLGAKKWMMRWNNSTIGATDAPACEFSSLAEGQNSGFTPLSSFDRDVRGITPLDSSSSNS